jgi:ComF family protein
MARAILMEVLYPKVCPGCGLRGMWLCEICRESVPPLDRDICPGCGSPVYERHHCQSVGDHVTKVRSAFPYTGWVAASVRRFKYGDEPTRAEDLAARMFPMVAAFGVIDVVVPIPLHPGKLNLRGYNQSELLAARIAAQANLSMKPLLIRTTATRSQVTLDQQSRHANVSGAFSLSHEWSIPAGQRILLIDDVRTTGATTDACAKVFKEDARAHAVSVLTFAQELSNAELRTWRQSISASPSQI